MSIRFDGKSVIVTGAGAGLGRAHALGFAARGAHVIVNDLSRDAAESVVADISATGGTAEADTTNASDRVGMARLVDGVVAARGAIDIIVANAGVLRDKSFAKMQDSEWDMVIDVHLGGAYAAAKAVWSHMRKRGQGRIILTSSGSGLYGNFGQANYAAAKMALVGLTRTLAIEGEKAGIKVNALAPVALTSMTLGLLPVSDVKAFAPELVTPGVLYLASETAPTGMVLSAGAGVFAEVRVLEARGLALGEGELSPEAIAASIATVRDMNGAESLDSSIMQTLKLAGHSKRR